MKSRLCTIVFLVAFSVLFLNPSQAKALSVSLDMEFSTTNTSSSIFYDYFNSIGIGEKLYFRFILTNTSTDGAYVYDYHIQTDSELGQGLTVSFSSGGLAPGQSWTVPQAFEGTYGYGPTTTVNTSGTQHINYANIDYLNSTAGSYAYDETYYITGSPAPAPEPATMLLLGFGLIGLAGVRRKLKQ